jgi:hygromycin-B 7''-O-kinase
MTEAAVPRPLEVPPAALLELARALRLPGPLVVSARWVGATSTVLRIGDLCVKVPHDGSAAVSSCLTHAAVAPAARRLGVSAPEVLAVHHVAGLPVPLVVSRFLPGQPLPRAERHTAVWQEVGRDLARLHRATPEQVDVGLRTFAQHDEVDPRRLTRALVETGRLDDALARRALRLLDRLVDQVLPDDRPVLCHGDVHTENVLVDHGHYSGLLDFAGAGWLDSAWDFATVPVPAVPSVVAGYREAGGAVDGLVSRVAWCRIPLALHRASGAADPAGEVAGAVREAEDLGLRGSRRT